MFQKSKYMFIFATVHQIKLKIIRKDSNIPLYWFIFIAVLYKEYQDIQIITLS